MHVFGSHYASPAQILYQKRKQKAEITVCHCKLITLSTCLIIGFCKYFLENVEKSLHLGGGGMVREGQLGYSKHTSFCLTDTIFVSRKKVHARLAQFLLQDPWYVSYISWKTTVKALLSYLRKSIFDMYKKMFHCELFHKESGHYRVTDEALLTKTT